MISWCPAGTVPPKGGAGGPCSSPAGRDAFWRGLPDLRRCLKSCFLGMNSFHNMLSFVIFKLFSRLQLLLSLLPIRRSALLKQSALSCWDPSLLLQIHPSGEPCCAAEFQRHRNGRPRPPRSVLGPVVLFSSVPLLSHTCPLLSVQFFCSIGLLLVENRKKRARCHRRERSRLWVEVLLVLSCRRVLHLPYLPPGERPRLPPYHRELQLCTAPEAAHRLPPACPAQRGALWELLCTNPLHLRLLHVL